MVLSKLFENMRLNIPSPKRADLLFVKDVRLKGYSALVVGHAIWSGELGPNAQRNGSTVPVSIYARDEWPPEATKSSRCRVFNWSVDR